MRTILSMLTYISTSPLGSSAAAKNENNTFFGLKSHQIGVFLVLHVALQKQLSPYYMYIYSDIN